MYLAEYENVFGILINCRRKFVFA